MIPKSPIKSRERERERERESILTIIRHRYGQAEDEREWRKENEEKLTVKGREEMSELMKNAHTVNAFTSTR